MQIQYIEKKPCLALVLTLEFIYFILKYLNKALKSRGIQGSDKQEAGVLQTLPTLLKGTLKKNCFAIEVPLKNMVLWGHIPFNTLRQRPPWQNGHMKVTELHLTDISNSPARPHLCYLSSLTFFKAAFTLK